MAKIVVALALGYPFDFKDVSTDFAFVYGRSPSGRNEKGGPVIESPSMAYRMVFLLDQEEVHGLLFEVKLLVRLFDSVGHEAYGVG